MQFTVIEEGGYVGYTTSIQLESPFPPDFLASFINASGMAPNESMPTMDRAEPIGNTPSGTTLVYQRFVTRILFIVDYTEFVLDYSFEEDEHRYLLSWQLVESPDGKTQSIQGSWELWPNEETGGSHLEYRSRTVFSRTDGFFRWVLQTFGQNEIRLGMFKIFDPLAGQEIVRRP